MFNNIKGSVMQKNYFAKFKTTADLSSAEFFFYSLFN